MPSSKAEPPRDCVRSRIDVDFQNRSRRRFIWESARWSLSSPCCSSFYSRHGRASASAPRNAPATAAARQQCRHPLIVPDLIGRCREQLRSVTPAAPRRARRGAVTPALRCSELGGVLGDTAVIYDYLLI